MSFLDAPIANLDAFFDTGRLLYAAAYLLWVAWVWRSARGTSLLWPTLLALLFWGINAYPLQRPYGLVDPGDRLRNISWGATAAAGNPPWKNGVGDGANLEPLWASLVSVMSLRDPGLVVAIYPYLSGLGIVLVGLGLGITFARSMGRLEGADSSGAMDGKRRAMFVVFFVLLATTQPLDFVGPFNGSLWKTFLLKPNHVLGLALLPVCASVLASPLTTRRSIVAVLLVGLLGWVFIIHWVLFSWCVVLLTAVGLLTGTLKPKDCIRLWMIVLLASILVAPYAYYLRTNFQEAVSLSPPWSPETPKTSRWGESAPSDHSLLFMVTLDLGLNFYLALWGVWVAWRRRSSFDLIWLSFAASAYSAWAVSAALYEMGRARGAAHVYLAVMFTAAVFAGIGTADLVKRVSERFAPEAQSARVMLNRVTAAGLLLFLPLSIPWWFRPHVMDAHFRVALDPIPQNVVQLAAWIRSNTRGSDRFLAGPSVASWIPALSGRPVAGIGRAQYNSQSYWDECAFVFPVDPQDAREAGRRLRLEYVVVDASLLEEHVLHWGHFEEHSLLEKVREDGSFRVYRVRYQ